MATKAIKAAVLGAVSTLAVVALNPSKAADLDLSRFIREQDRSGPAGAVGHTPLKGKVAPRRSNATRK